MGRYLVTGGAGFIGSHVCDGLLGRGDTVFCLDNFNRYYDEACNSGDRFVGRKTRNISRALRNPQFILLPEIDIRNADHVRRRFPQQLDAVVHLAARAGVRKSIEEPAIYWETNVDGTKNVIEAAYDAGVRRFVIASSSSVYGNNEKLPFSEEDPIEKTASPYAKTKKAMEEWCCEYHAAHPPTQMTLLRFFSVYGPRGRPDMAPYKFTDLAWRGMKIPQYGDGSMLRDWTYVNDIVSGIIAALDKPFPFEIVNLGNSKPVALRDLINHIGSIVPKPVNVQKLDPQDGDVRHTFADISKAERLLGWKPTTSLEEGLTRFWDWYRNEELPVPDRLS